MMSNVFKYIETYRLFYNKVLESMKEDYTLFSEVHVCVFNFRDINTNKFKCNFTSLIIT